MLFKRQTTNGISLSGVLLLVICFFLPFHNLGCSGHPESIFETIISSGSSFADLFKGGLIMSVIPSLTALYILVVVFILSFFNGKRLEISISFMNFFMAVFASIGLAWFYISAFFSGNDYFDVFPQVIYVSLLICAFLLFMKKYIFNDGFYERFYVYKIFAGTQSLIFYVSLIYFFVLKPKFFSGEKADDVPGIIEAFCYAYWFSIFGAVLLVIGNTKKVISFMGGKLCLK